MLKNAKNITNAKNIYAKYKMLWYLIWKIVLWLVLSTRTSTPNESIRDIEVLQMNVIWQNSLIWQIYEKLI